jgi:hypothetical protein
MVRYRMRDKSHAEAEGSRDCVSMSIAGIVRMTREVCIVRFRE